jgi:peptide/nickel transport system substrate-binding protein
MKISKVLSFREKFMAAFLILVAALSFLFWIRYIYRNITVPIPKKGGEYTEGIVGQPVYVNPLLSQANEADADLSQLIYSGLFKYDNEGNPVKDLTESYEISDDQKTYTIHLRKDALWHDKQAVTADDAVFTFNILKDSAYKSPLRQSWQDVSVAKVDDYTFTFDLKNPYFGFLGNLTVGILPKHIWQGIAPEKFFLANINTKPIGSGPYKFVNAKKDSEGNVISFEMAAFDKYYGGEPNITRLVFNFYPDEDMMLDAYNKKEIKGISKISSNKTQLIKNEKTTHIYQISLPYYFAIFFNQIKSVPLADGEVRKALAYATNRNEIIGLVIEGKGTPVFSPFLPSMKEYANDVEKYDFNPDKANEILDAAGWKMNEEKGIREKDGVELKFGIFTTDWPDLEETAQALSRQWEAVGARAEVNTLTVSDLQQNYIRPREYDSLIFGQAINFVPDVYSFWHSSQKDDPGLNLSLFVNKQTDDILDSARQESDRDKRVEKYRELQKILADKIPAIFLYSPSYLYAVSDEVQGIDVKNLNAPFWRFADVNKWYVKTKRVFK